MALPSPPYRLAYFVSHPIQYQAPLLRLLAGRPEIELTVFFYSDFSLAAYYDKEFGRAVQWDVPLTDGYRYHFLSRVADQPTQSRWGQLRRQLSARTINRTLSDGRFDVVWVHGWAHLQSFQAIWTARRRGLLTVLRGETNILAPASAKGGWNAHAKKFLRDSLLGWLFNQVDGFLAIGTRNREFYLSRGVDMDRIFDMPYAVDNAFFQTRVAAALPQREALRAELGLPPGRPVILFAAKLIDKKRPRDLWEAYRLLSPDGGFTEPGSCLLYVGDGALGEELRRDVRQTGWQSVCFAGFRNQSEMPAFYDLCDVLVLPSDFEPWGLVVNEAMNAGKPVIVSDRVGAAADLVKPGYNGFVYPIGDVIMLAQKLQELTADPPLREQMGQHSLDRINHWGLQETCDGMVRALTDLSVRHHVQFQHVY